MAESDLSGSGRGAFAPRRLESPRREPLLEATVGVGGSTPPTGPEFSPKFPILWE